MIYQEGRIPAHKVGRLIDNFVTESLAGSAFREQGQRFNALEARLRRELRVPQFLLDDRVRLAALALLILSISVLHHLTPHNGIYNDIFRWLYYVPILLGGIWFNMRGGLATSIAVSILYSPYVLTQLGNPPSGRIEEYLGVLFYIIVGFCTGYLAQRDKAQKALIKNVAKQLEESQAKQKVQTDLILDIESELSRVARLADLGEISAGLAHEIRNSLSGIRGAAEILQCSIDPKDSPYEFATILTTEADRLNAILENCLRFARPDLVKRVSFDVAEALNEVIVQTKPQLLQVSVKTRIEGETLSPLTGNREQLKQVFLNLILNAAQAMPEGGTLVMETAQKEDYAEISFADTGTGISTENLEKIFNPFFTTRKKGTGLGLAISRRIIHQHGGQINVMSKVGKGTTFTLILPLASSFDVPCSEDLGGIYQEAETTSVDIAGFKVKKGC